jgi:hypothetical protein
MTDENIENAECEICDHLIDVCEVFGKGKTCKDAIEDMKKGNISVEELMDIVDKNFDKEAFKREWDRLVDEKQKGSDTIGD